MSRRWFAGRCWSPRSPWRCCSSCCRWWRSSSTRARRACSSSLGDPAALDALRLSLVCRRADRASRSSCVVGTPAAYLLATRRFRGRALVGHAGRAAARAAAGGGGHRRCSPRSGPSGAARAPLRTPGQLVADDRRRGRRAHVRLRAVLPAPGAGRVRGARPHLARRLAHARRGRGADVRCASRSPAPCPGSLAGLALAWGRALGEFGATLMFAGSFRGVTQTVPLAIYERFSTDFTGALALSAVLVARLGARCCWRSSCSAVGVARRCCALRPGRGSGALELDVALEVAGRRAASRWPGPSGAGKTIDPAGRRRAAAARARAACAAARRCGSTPRAASTSPPERAALRLRLPGLRAVRRTCARGERRLRPARHPRAERRRARTSCSTRFGVAELADARPRDAVGRRAPARRARPRARAATRRRCCSTSRCPRSTRARARSAARELAAVLARRRRAGAARHPRLHRGGAARRPRRRDRPRPHRPGGHRGRARRRARPPRSWPTSPAPSCSPATREPGADGLTRVALDGGGTVASTDTGRRARSRSASTRGRSRSTPGAQRRRLGAEPPRRRGRLRHRGRQPRPRRPGGRQPLVAEITAAAVRELSRWPRGARVAATWKAAATRVMPL